MRDDFVYQEKKGFPTNRRVGPKIQKGERGARKGSYQIGGKDKMESQSQRWSRILKITVVSYFQDLRNQQQHVSPGGQKKWLKLVIICVKQLLLEHSRRDSSLNAWSIRKGRGLETEKQGSCDVLVSTQGLGQFGGGKRELEGKKTKRLP